MEVTYCKQTIKYSAESDQPDIVKRYPLHYFDQGSEVKAGFQKGTLLKATFELTNGATLIYEKLDERNEHG